MAADIGASRRAWVAPATVGVLWGINAVLVKSLVAELVPVHVQTIRLLIGSLTLLVLASLEEPSRRGHWDWLQRVPRPAWRLAVLAAVCGYGVHHLMLGLAMQSGEASLNSVIFALYPLTTAILAHLFLGETVTPRRIVGVVVAFAGVAIAVADEWRLAASVGVAELLMFVAMFTFVVGALFVAKAKGFISQVRFTTITNLITAGLLLLASAAHITSTGWPAIPTRASFWLGISASAVVATGLCNHLWNGSIQRIGAARTSVYVNLMPVTSVLTAGLVLGESMTLLQWVGFFAVLGGLYLGTATHRPL